MSFDLGDIVGIFAFLLASISALGYLYLVHCFRYWETRRIVFLPPESKLFGNDVDLVTGKLSFAENTQKLYNKLSPHPLGGVFHFQTPIMYVRDPEIIRSVLIKHFDHFTDHGFHFENEKEPLTLHLFNLTGDRWRQLRAKLTPTFTSGKMKMMFFLVKACADNLKTVLDAKAEANQSVPCKDLMARYMTDVISTCAFGIETDTLHEQESQFRTMGAKLFKPSVRSRLRDILFSLSPRFTKFLGIKNFPNDVSEFFTNVVNDTIQYRRKNNVRRGDFLDLLIKLLDDEDAAKRESSQDKSQDENKYSGDGKEEDTNKICFNWSLLAAQCFVFYLAGFETSSTVVTFMMYELASNEHVQRKLQAEVDQVLEKHNGEITYDSLQEMPYMDKVISETMRLYPATPILMRTCTKDFQIPNTDVLLNRGQVLFIPQYALHRDPQYFPDPETFNPENFSEVAKSSRPAYAYLPFGEGPRMCIGIRFGMMQVKTAVTMIMKNYNVELSPEIELPVKISPFSFLTTPKNEVLVKCRGRKFEKKF